MAILHKWINRRGVIECERCAAIKEERPCHGKIKTRTFFSVDRGETWSNLTPACGPSPLDYLHPITGATLRICTKHECPPIPTRVFDWVATFENYDLGDPLGYGSSREAAISDLLRQDETWPIVR